MSTTAAPAAAAPASAPAPSTKPAAPSATSASNAPSAPAAPANPKGLPPGDLAADKAAHSTPKPGQSEPNADASEPKEPTEAQKEAARRHKIKVNGKEHEVDEAELIRRAQLGWSADERFKEAAEMRKQFEGFFETLRNDPMSILTHPELGIDFRGLSEKYLTDELKKELMPPEQRELEELRQFKQQSEAQRQRQEQEQMTRAQQQELMELQTRAAREYDTKITEALKASDLPKTPYTVKRVVEVMQNALAKDYDLDVATAVDIVREGYMTDVQSLVGSLDGESLVKALGDDIVKKIRKHDLAGLRKKLEGQQAPQPATAPTPRQPAQRGNEPKKLNTHEWLAQIRAKAGV